MQHNCYRDSVIEEVAAKFSESGWHWVAKEIRAMSGNSEIQQVPSDGAEKWLNNPVLAVTV